VAARKKPKTIELREGTLTLVFEGLKVVPQGPYKGEKTIGAVKIYIGEEQIGLLQRFKMEAFANEPLPRLEFDFGELPPEAIKESPLKALYEKAVARIREFFPWSKWVSPVGSSPPETPLELQGVDQRRQ